MKRILASIVLAGLVVPAFAFAQETETRPVRTLPVVQPKREVPNDLERPGRRPEVEELREEVKGAAQQRVEARKAEINTKKEEVKAKVEAKREEVKAKVAEKKGERLDARLQAVKASFERMGKVFDATLQRLVTLKNRLSERVGLLQDKGVDVTASKAALGEVETALADNRAQIDTFKATVAALVVPTTTGSTTAKLDLTNVRQDAKDVRDSFTKSRKALDATVKAMRSDANAAKVSADN